MSNDGRQYGNSLSLSLSNQQKKAFLEEQKERIKIHQNKPEYGYKTTPKKQQKYTNPKENPTDQTQKAHIYIISKKKRHIYMYIKI